MVLAHNGNDLPILRTRTRVLEFTEISVQEDIVPCKLGGQLLEGMLIPIPYLFSHGLRKYQN